MRLMLRKLLSLTLVLLPATALASGIYNPGSSGGGGSGSGIVSPGTFTWTNSFGIGVSTIQMTGSVATITGLNDGTTTYGAVNLNQLAYANINNILINGGMELYQRGASFSVTQSSQSIYTLDRWQTAMQGSSWLGTVSSSTIQVDSGLSSLRINVSSLGSSPVISLRQFVENYYDYAGSSVTLTVRIFQSGLNEACFAQINDNVGSTPTNIASVTGAWQTLTATRFLPAGITTLYVTLVGFQSFTNDAVYWDSAMLVRGGAPMPFNPRPLGQELSLAQRYYEKSYAVNTAPRTNTAQNNAFLFGGQYGATSVRYIVPFQTYKRTSNPTIQIIKNDGTLNSWNCRSTSDGDSTQTMSLNDSGNQNFQMIQTGILDLSCFGQWTADSEIP